MTYSIRSPWKAGLALAAGLVLTVPVTAFAGDGYYSRDTTYRGSASSCRERRADNATGGAVAGVIVGAAAGGVPGAIVGGAVVGTAAASGTRCYRTGGYAYDDYGNDSRYDDRSYNNGDRYRNFHYRDNGQYRQGYEDGFNDANGRSDDYDGY